MTFGPIHIGGDNSLATLVTWTFVRSGGRLG